MTPAEKRRALVGLVFGVAFGALLGSAGPIASGAFVAVTCSFLGVIGSVTIGGKR